MKTKNNYFIVFKVRFRRLAADIAAIGEAFHTVLRDIKSLAVWRG